MDCSHLAAGFQVNFSPDGKFLMSGDSVGKLFFWEWAHPNRVVKTLPAHDKVRDLLFCVVAGLALRKCMLVWGSTHSAPFVRWCWAHSRCMSKYCHCAHHGRCALCFSVARKSTAMPSKDRAQCNGVTTWLCGLLRQLLPDSRQVQIT